MTVSYLTRTELGKEDGVKHLDSDVKDALFKALYLDDIYHDTKKDDGTTAVFQDGLDHGKVDPTTQILEIDKSATVDTTPSLKAIIMDDASKDGSATWLTVTGSSDVFVATGDAGDTVRLHDSGNDTVYAGSNAHINAKLSSGNDSLVGAGGHDTIHGGIGQDTLIGSGGHDKLVAGSGSHQWLQGNDGNDTLVAGIGSGQHDMLLGAGGNDKISDTNSSPTYDTLMGTGGNDTITGQQGDTFLETGNKGSQFWLYGSSDTMAGSMLVGGKGNDTFHIETNVGNDTIIGGGGKDNIVDFGTRTFADYKSASLVGGSGSYTLTFKDGQQFSLSGIQELHFGSHTVTLS
jgi:Ca2+-binding RTX toxin-like protein